MKVERKIHNGHIEWESAMKDVKFRKMVQGNKFLSCPFGKYQYIYCSKKGEISLVKLLNNLPNTSILWEIYCLKGNLFEDVERFRTKKDAEKKIKRLLK